MVKTYSSGRNGENWVDRKYVYLREKSLCRNMKVNNVRSHFSGGLTMFERIYFKLFTMRKCRKASIHELRGIGNNPQSAHK